MLIAIVLINWELINRALTNKNLLTQLLNHHYFTKTPPKSTGREDFNLPWLEDIISESEYSTKDVQATLLEFTAETIAREVTNLPDTTNEIYICGGGAYNKQLMFQLEKSLYPKIIASTSQLETPPEWVEATAFAWLAKQTLTNHHHYHHF